MRSPFGSVQVRVSAPVPENAPPVMVPPSGLNWLAKPTVWLAT